MNRTRRTALAAVAALATFPAASRGDEIARSIDASIRKLGKDARVSVLVRSITTGETLYERDAESPLAPASTMKLATTGAALTLLGAGYEHVTRVFAAGPLRSDGTLSGNLVVRGAGDPSLSRRFQIDDSKPLLADWAEELAKKVHVIEGDLVADDRAFERLGFHPDWNRAEAQDWYAAEVSALDLNDNCVDIETSVEGGAIHAVARPETKAIVLDVKATPTAQRREHRLSYARDLDGWTFHVSGKCWLKAPPYEAPVAVTRPALFFVHVLADRLREAGIALRGKIRLAEASDPQPSGEPLLVRRSPLPRALMVCNKRSQNLYAECLFKTLGLEKGHGGSWEEGAKVVTKFLTDLDVPTEQVRVRDGSGLSRENRLSARALVTVLAAMAKGSSFSVFDESLSIAGTDGTLEKRLRGLPRGATFHGKTGTMHGVSALAGYIELEHGAHGEHEVLALAFVVNGTHGASLARQAQDAVVRTTVRDRSTSGTKAPTGERP